MFASMQIPRVDLFEWLLQKSPLATYNLAFSNIDGLTLQEYKQLVDFPLSDSFEMGSNALYGADELKKTLGEIYHCCNENIVTTTGASEANFLLYTSLLSKDDEFIIEQPGYQPMWLTPEMLGARKINWHRTFDEKFKVDIDALQNLLTKKTKLVVLTNLHNPSGVLVDRTTIQSIAKSASEYGASVLVDEIFLDGSFSLQQSSFGIPNVIVTGSTTKIYGLGGLHSGWIIAPPEVAARCQKLKAHTTGAASYVSEVLTACILRTARIDLIKRFQDRSKSNLVYLKKWMSQHTEFFDWVEPDGGIVCFPKYTLPIPSVELCLSLFETQKLLVNPGSYFNSDGFIRLSYGCPEPVFHQALDALEKGLQQLMNRF
jgi:aspartate/methionine/tyrosine aminotransferase